MRQGMNPLRQKIIDKPFPPAVPVVAVITHLPDEGGYHKERYKIVRESLLQAHKLAGVPHWFVVWDNGSCKEFTDFLNDVVEADAIILSKNIGISNAMRSVLSMYQDCIVALSNDDIYYEQDWLKSQIEILTTYPNVGTVSGVTTRFYMGKGTGATERWARQAGVRVSGKDIPPQWDEEHGMSIGKARHAHLQEFGKIQAPLIEYNGIKAIIGGNHCQFTCYASRIQSLIQPSNRYMEQLFPLDLKIDAVGYLRLLTPERTAKHIGNVE